MSERHPGLTNTLVLSAMAIGGAVAAYIGGIHQSNAEHATSQVVHEQEMHDRKAALVASGVLEGLVVIDGAYLSRRKRNQE